MFISLGIATVLIFSQAGLTSAEGSTITEKFREFASAIINPLITDIETSTDAKSKQMIHDIENVTGTMLENTRSRLEAHADQQKERAEKELNDYKAQKILELQDQIPETYEDQLTQATNDEIQKGKAAIDAKIAEILTGN